MKTPVATTAQRRRTLRNIRYAEANMLPPGWDKGLEHQFGSALTEPTQHPAASGTGLQQQDSIRPAQPRHSSPRPAHQPMPTPTTRRDRLAALGRWLATAVVCAGLALTFIYHP